MILPLIRAMLRQRCRAMGPRGVRCSKDRHRGDHFGWDGFATPVSWK